MRISAALAALGLAPQVAGAQTLDQVFPVAVPGFGAAPGVTVLSRLHPENMPRGITYGDLSVFPAFSLGAGLDTAPANGAGSSVLTATPSVRLDDPLIGLGGFASDTVQRYPARPGLDSNSLSAALGADLPLGAARLTLGLGRADLGETALGVTPVGPSFSTTAPYRLIATGAHAALKLPVGAFDVIGRAGIESARLARADQTSGLVLPYGTERQLTGGLTIETEAGQPMRFVGEIRAEGLRYGDVAPQSGIGNSTRISVLAGLATSQIALWTFRCLVGVARRIGAGPGRRSAPVLEMALGWTPDALSAVGLDVTRKLDPASVLGAPDTVVTAEHLTGALAYRRDLTLTAGLTGREAVLGGAPSHEIDVDAGVTWHLSRLLALVPRASMAFRHNVAGVADREFRLSVDLLVTP